MIVNGVLLATVLASDLGPAREIGRVCLVSLGRCWRARNEPWWLAGR